MFSRGGPIKLSINVVRNIEDPCGFGRISAGGMSPPSVIVTGRKGMLKYKQKVLKHLLGTGLKYSFILRPWLFDVDAMQRGAEHLGVVLPCLDWKAPTHPAACVCSSHHHVKVTLSELCTSAFCL